jgi:hypothetical protein
MDISTSNNLELMNTEKFCQFKYQLQMTKDEYEALFKMILVVDVSTLPEGMERNAIKMQLVAIIGKMRKGLVNLKNTSPKAKLTLKLDHTEAWVLSFILDDMIFDNANLYENNIALNVIGLLDKSLKTLDMTITAAKVYYKMIENE